MSIEPIIASKARYQDSDLTPKDNVRNFFAGGGTSEKFNSYWDNATGVSDSQSEESEPESVQDSSGGTTPSQSESGNVLSFSRSSSFSAGSFSFSPMAFGREQVGNMVEFGRMDLGAEARQDVVISTPDQRESDQVQNVRNEANLSNEDSEVGRLDESELEDDEDSVSKAEASRASAIAAKGAPLLTQSRRTSTGVNSTAADATVNSELLPAQTREASEVKSVVMPVQETAVQSLASDPKSSNATQSPAPLATAVSALQTQEMSGSTPSSGIQTPLQSIDPANQGTQSVAGNRNANPLISSQNPQPVTQGQQGLVQVPQSEQSVVSQKLDQPVQTPVDKNLQATQAQSPLASSTTEVGKPVIAPSSLSSVKEAPVAATQISKSDPVDSLTPMDDQLAINADKANADVRSALKQSRPQGIVSNADTNRSIGTEESRPASTISQSPIAETLKATEVKSAEGFGTTQAQKELSTVDAKTASASRSNQEAIESRNASVQRQATSADTSAANASAAAKESSTSRAIDSQHVQAQTLAGARDLRTSSAQAGNAAKAQAKSTTSLNGINGTNTTSTAGGLNTTLGTGTLKDGANAQSQQQGSSKGDDAKQEFSANLKNAMSGAKGTEKSGTDGSQSFSLNETSSSTSTRRSEAAAKAQGTSYASKSVEEVKDIYAALSRGVDRMLSTKQDSMNVTINFDQGGSISMKLSVENGQINTIMDTDLAGLEEVIKASWGDLSSEWNQKGLKLNAPQFSQNGSQGKDNSFASFEQKGQQQSQEFGQTSDSQGSSPKNSGGGNQLRRRGTAIQADGASGEGMSTSVGTESVSSDSELQTYA